MSCKTDQVDSERRNIGYFESCIVQTYNVKLTYFDIRWACAIEMEDKVIITGGALSLGFVASDKAIVYNDDGFVEELPALRIKRWGHGCGHYITETTDGIRVG